MRSQQLCNIQMNFTASDREQEQRLAYFREDMGVNSTIGIGIWYIQAKNR